MAASCTLREFDARFLRENWEFVYIDGRVFGLVPVVYWVGTSFIVPIYAYILV